MGARRCAIAAAPDSARDWHCTPGFTLHCPLTETTDLFYYSFE